MRRTPHVVPLGHHHADDGRLRPARLRLGETAAAVRGIKHPREAWYALRQPEVRERVFRLVADYVVGPRWRDASRSTPNFDGGPAGLLRCAVFDLPHPHTVEDAIAFASDGANILAVERAARQHVDAMHGWSFGVYEERIAWRFLRKGTDIPRQPGCLDLRTVEECLIQALERAGMAPLYEGGKRVKSVGELWRDACVHGLVVPSELDDPYFLYGAVGPPLVPDAVRGRAFADLPNPVQALERIESLGYMLETVAADAIVLIGAAPSAAAPRTRGGT